MRIMKNGLSRLIEDCAEVGGDGLGAKLKVQSSKLKGSSKTKFQTSSASLCSGFVDLESCRENVGESSRRCRTTQRPDGAFPITPTLSPREREQRTASRDYPSGLTAQVRGRRVSLSLGERDGVRGKQP